ncbi:MAG: hypothetical protein LBJ67_14770 [Planctomycetaceae bacterium]|jgi:hypothetical protein|nr:hypothetical protein [Planctomycetaceae bacterium]
MSYAGRGRSSGNENCVALFPFLSVLICTLGMLILLLIVIARNARTQAAEQADEQANVATESLQGDAEMMQVMADDLIISKEKTIADVENERAKLAVLESSIEKMVAEIKRTENSIRDLENNRGKIQFDQNQWNAEIAAKKEALQKAKAEWEELQKQAADGKNKSYAVVPYRGLNGTQRRPVYIECRKDCVIIQPEEIVLYEDDFFTAAHPDNPLDAMIRAASLFYTETEAVPAGTKPYPLILVRPDGIDAYYAVRAAIQSWSEHFGYELVGADWQLQFPNANGALKQRLETQLAASRERMMPFKAAVMRRLAESERATAGNGISATGRNQTNNGQIGGRRFAEMSEGDSSNGGYGTNHRYPGTFNGNESSEERKTQIANLLPSGNYSSVPDEPFSPSVNSNRNNPPFRPDQFLQAKNPSAAQNNNNASPETQNALSSLFSDSSIQDWQTPRRFGEPPREPSRSDSANDRLPQTQNSPSHTANPNPQPSVPQTSAARSSSSGNGQTAQIDPTHDGAMPKVYRGATEMVRVISAECRANAIVFKASGNRGIDREILIPNNGTVYDVQNELVPAIREYVETWGQPGEGMYWQPEISVMIYPGAERRFEEIKSLLQAAKIKVNGKM